jgi:hypothetical protein
MASCLTISPELADLVDDEMASGNTRGYRFRYRITSSPDSDSAGDSGFEISATPAGYGKAGRRSFFRDANGTVHAADKHGEMATASDPQWQSAASADAPPTL